LFKPPLLKIFWLTQTLNDIPESTSWLHPQEEEVYRTFKFALRKQSWLLGRWTAKKALLQILSETHPGISMQKIAVLRNTDGSPAAYYQGLESSARISLSHSNGTGFCTVSCSDAHLGCDIEKITPRHDAFARDYFTKNEISLLSQLDEATIPLAVNLIWSAKESALKALKTGLRLDTRQVQITFEPDFEQSGWKTLSASVNGNYPTFRGYWKSAIGFVLTIIADGPHLDLQEIHG
jgi:4'-phosphopantetheinyl transferase